MSRPAASPEIAALAEERSRARAAQDWPAADELRGRIEAAGWRVEDDGLEYTLWPARAADVIEADLTFYGSVEAVPSRLGEAATTAASVVVVGVTEASTVAVLQALARHRHPDTQVLAVVPRGAPAAVPSVEIVGTVEPFSPGDAIQAALRRATGAVIVVLDAGRVPSHDIVAPLLAELGDPSVAVVGNEGLLSADLRRFQPTGPGDVTALRSGCYAFRRADAIARGPLDGRLHLADSVATWWSLVLRDQGPDAVARRALAIDLPLSIAGEAPALPENHARQARRDAYRIAARFARRRDLAGPQQQVAGMPRDGSQDDDGGDAADQHGDADEPEGTGPAGRP